MTMKLFNRLGPVGILCLILISTATPAKAQGQKPLTEADLTKLIELQIDNQVIVGKLEKEGVKFEATPEVIDRLKKAGASTEVLAAVEKAATQKPSSAGTKVPVTYQDVLKLLELGIDENEILKRLENSPTHFVPGEREVEQLKKAGASAKLLAAMQGGRAQSKPGGDITDFALILDCSGSMIDKTKEGPTKMEAAKKVVTELMESIPNGRRVAFLIYGHDRALKCKAVKVVRPLTEIDDAAKAELRNAIAELQPVGHTPIALALRTAGQELAKAKGSCQLVLITDGMETCHGDPGKEAAELVAKLNLPHGIQVIGFDVDPKEREAVEQIARAGKGKYFDVHSATDLVKAVGQVVAQVPVITEVRNVRGIRVVQPGFDLPPMKKIAVTLASDAGNAWDSNRFGPGGTYYKEFKEVTKYDELVRIPSTEKYSIWWQPAEGMPVLMVKEFSIKERKTVTFRPDDYFGMIRVTGSGKINQLAVTPGGKGSDPSRYGPGGTYYNAYQTCPAYGKDMVVAAGTYDVWLVPADGGKPSLLEANVEVKPGKVSEIAN
jgi:Mg-chelatase subunit ChlD